MFLLKHLKQRLFNIRNQEQVTITTPERSDSLQTNLICNSKAFTRIVPVSKNNSEPNKQRSQKPQLHQISKCQCENCLNLPELTECGLCMESLQGNGANSCPVCANIVCLNCATKLKHCAYCRSSLPSERNRALERLIGKLQLPCKNSRYGCKVTVDGSTRLIHESICNYNVMKCPIIHEICKWQGTVHQVQSHIKASHNLQALQNQGVSVEIHSFRDKAKANDGRVYTVCLSCHEQLFFIRLILFQGKLRFCLRQLGYTSINNPPPEDCIFHYEIWLSVRPTNGRRLRGVVPFGKFDHEIHEITLNCDEIYNKAFSNLQNDNNNLNNELLVEGDLVKVDLLVKKIQA